MIITRHKPFDKILEFIEDVDKIYLVGCELCAKVCKTGGEDALKKIAKKLEENGKKITGFSVLNPACNVLEVKRLHRNAKKEIEAADAILSFACGGGTQALAEQIKDKVVYPGNDTLFQGEIYASGIKGTQFDQKCSLCGDCILMMTGGICPVTRCPKGLLNGPCGGVKNGKCEIEGDIDCVWLLIYDKLKSFGQLDKMRTIKKPKDNRARKTPQELKI